MKLVTPLMTLLAVFWTSSVTTEGLTDMRETVQHPYNQQMMEYIRDRMEEEYSDIDLVDKPKMKRWWGSSRSNSWSNKQKQKDNKSYGMWITGLNKAGNKRKRTKAEGRIPTYLAPYIPAMNLNEHYPLPGFPQYTDVQQLVQEE